MLIYFQMIETDEDRSKFEEIYKEYLNLLLYLANKRLRNQQDAEDAAHKVFVKIAERIKEIEPVSPKTRRLLVIMIENTVTDILRAKNKHTRYEYTYEELAQDSTLYKEDTLVRCILKLTEQQQAVIWLKYNDGYNLREIAKILGISLSWAQKIDQRAKRRLEKLYREENGSL